MRESMLLGASDFGIVGLAVAVTVGLAAVILILAHALGPKRAGPVKDATYESGMEPVGDTRRRFNIRFYLIAVLFLIFDVEVLFLLPWAVLYPRLTGSTGEQYGEWASALSKAGYTPLFWLAAMGIFFGLLLVGFVYEWRRGVFKWN
jgi:NADH-quinone oxidoreductase subunit A